MNPPGPPDPPGLPGPGYLLLRGHINFDLPRLGFLAQWKPHGQHAVLVLSADLAGVHRLRKRERAAERAVVPLDSVERLFLHLVRELLLALEGERAVVHGD